MNCLDTLDLGPYGFACELPDDHADDHRATGHDRERRPYVVTWSREREQP